ncbi:hypothetical protein Tco_1211550 [Tanacetum coccineum]
MEAVLLPQVHHEFMLWGSCKNKAKSRYNTRLANLLPRHIYSPCVMNWDVLNGMGCDGEIDDMLRIKLREAESSEEIFTSVGGLRSDDHFNAQEYWLSISREENLGLSRIHTSTIWNLILRVIHKMITYGLCQRTIGWKKRKRYWYFQRTEFSNSARVDQSTSQKIARKARVLTDVVLRTLGCPRVLVFPSPQRAYEIQDLYDKRLLNLHCDLPSQSHPSFKRLMHFASVSVPTFSASIAHRN